ncbi:hypothetical protein DYB25_007800 [Aphanomyces astaci]|uniref:Uncharacterized protein n=1 Tax=Aphanomyces astaci TaxID=112090 RepID=A0A397AUB1_APHAT|nr:hypothetical protein DYB25_007800 [Aphanomyces astaci]RHY40442.1 hypothetical protein DYB34_010331 [Aphanomyces astaci]
MTPDNQTRLVEGIGSTIDLSVAEATAAQKALEEQVAQMSSHGRNLEDSLRIAREKIAALEDQASTMSSHGRTLQDSLRIAHDEIARLTRASESETPSTSRLKSIKLDVAKFGGAERPHVFQLRSPWTLLPGMPGPSPCSVSRPTLARFFPYRARYPLASPPERST